MKSLSPKGKYSVWYETMEQWDPDDIDEPVRVCEASGFIHAAEMVADDTDHDHVVLIVRDDLSGVYRHIELVRGWELKSNQLTSLDELSEP